MRACREGGPAIEAALRALDRDYFGVLAASCRRSVHDRDAARDLVQEAFIKVWQRCATFHGESELLPWVQAILRNGILDWLRRRRHEGPLNASAPDDPMTADALDRLLAAHGTPAATPMDELRRLQLAECFERCWRRFEAMAPEHATVIGWIAADGLTNDEIAALLERTPGATREFVSQCRKRARVHLAEWYALALGTEVTT